MPYQGADYRVLSPHILILDVADFHRGRKYLRHLRKLCGNFGILPSSFMLPPASVERDDTSFAWGGYSEVWKATFNGRPVAIKTFNVTTQVDRVKLHKVSNFDPKTSRRLLTLHL